MVKNTSTPIQIFNPLVATSQIASLSRTNVFSSHALQRNKSRDLYLTASGYDYLTPKSKEKQRFITFTNAGFPAHNTQQPNTEQVPYHQRNLNTDSSTETNRPESFTILAQLRCHRASLSQTLKLFSPHGRPLAFAKGSFGLGSRRL
jgi:hypothetical protein